MGKEGKKKGNNNPSKSARQQKVERLALKKKKQEEMKEVLRSLKDNQLSHDVLQNFEAAKLLGQKQHKQKELLPKNKRNRHEDDDVDEAEEITAYEEAKVHQKDQKETIGNEEDMTNPEEEKPINIFQMKSYENTKKVKTEEKPEVGRRTLEEIEQEATEKMIREELQPNLSVNPFKELKKIPQEESKDAEKEEKGVENFVEVYDEDLRKFMQGSSAKYNQIIDRNEENRISREKLPIFMRESDIIEAINNNLITIISGETGSGKSTQVPQFLYERGYSNPEGLNPGKIGITQPRRIAAIALAKRVADEMGTKLGEAVAFQVRHESSNLNENNRIKFMTDGILLREMTTDFLLTEYSLIMIDEAHERKVNTDILIGLLSRVVNVRFKLAREEKIRRGENYDGKYEHYPLRLVIMSATLRVKDFTENKFLFPKTVCTINVESRQFPLTTFFSKVTRDDYFEEALKKCIKIHKKLPPGGILVFLTGEKEIRDFCRKLSESLKEKEVVKLYGDDEEEETPKQHLQEGQKTRMNMLDLDIDVSDNEDDEPAYKNEDFDGEQIREELKEAESINLEAFIVPLYSKLPLQEQEKIFKAVDEKNRLIVVSTNVAETSLTIPGIRYVIDSGKEKKKVYDEKLSISHYKIDWISQASADQRAGRAARVGPGYCYRLYSRAVCGNILAQYREPEIMSMPLENIILQLKAVGIKDTMKFPFPTRPHFKNIKIALKNLLQLKALEFEEKNPGDEDKLEDLVSRADEQDLSYDNTSITQLGRALSYIPIAPRFAKMILMGRKEGCLEFSMLIAAGLSVEEIYQNENQSILTNDLQEEGGQNANIKQSFTKKYEKFIAGNSDLFTIMNILGEFIKFLYQRCPTLDEIDKLEIAIKDFAAMYNLIAKNLKAVFLNFRQLINIFETLIEKDLEKQKMIETFQNYKPPITPQLLLLQEMIVSISTVKVARKVKRNQKSLKNDYIYETIEHDVEVHIHPNSCLKGNSPDFVVYDELMHTSK